MIDQKPTNLPKELVWHAPEYQEYEKHPLWFVVFALCTALLVLYGIYTKSWTTSLLFLLLGILGVIYASKKPNTIRVKLDGTGIQINNLIYNYRTVKKFWIIYYPPEVKSLEFETTAYLNRIVKVELGKQDPRDVKAFLKQYLEEDLDQEESFVDAIARKLRF